jgi:hypothetical protein
MSKSTVVEAFIVNPLEERDTQLNPALSVRSILGYALERNFVGELHIKFSTRSAASYARKMLMGVEEFKGLEFWGTNETLCVRRRYNKIVHLP